MFDSIQLDPVLTYPDIFEGGDFFSPFWFFVFRPHVNGVFGHQKRRFSKTVPRVAYSFCVKWPKAEVFEYDDVLHRGRERDEMTKISASLEVSKLYGL